MHRHLFIRLRSFIGKGISHWKWKTQMIFTKNPHSLWLEPTYFSKISHCIDLTNTHEVKFQSSNSQPREYSRYVNVLEIVSIRLSCNISRALTTANPCTHSHISPVPRQYMLLQNNLRLRRASSVEGWGVVPMSWWRSFLLKLYARPWV